MAIIYSCHMRLSTFHYSRESAVLRRLIAGEYGFFFLSRQVVAETIRVQIDTTNLTYLYARCTHVRATRAGYSFAFALRKNHT